MSCMVSDTAMARPQRTHHTGPATGIDTEVVLDAAVESLGTVRGLQWVGDGGARLHVLASLMAEARARLPRAVADARDQDYSWAEIGDLLGITRAAAWQRFARPGHRERRTPVDD